MEKQISDTELVNSNMNSWTGSSTECLKAPTRAKCSLKVFWVVMNEAGVIVRVGRYYDIIVYRDIKV